MKKKTTAYETTSEIVGCHQTMGHDATMARKTILVYA